MERAAQLCRECGTSLDGRDKRTVFCSPKCRSTFNHRRQQRGAELYDLFMMLRYERAIAGKYNLWSRMCRLGEIYRDADHVERAGRKSWQGINAIVSSAKAASRTMLKVR